MTPKTLWDRPDVKFERLAPKAAERLEAEVRRVLSKGPNEDIQSQLDSLTSKTLWFCESELRLARKLPGNIKTELRSLRNRTHAFLKFLDGLSPEARNEVDCYVTDHIDIPEHWFSEDPKSLTDDNQSHTATALGPPFSMRSDYLDPVAEKLTGLMKHVDAALREEYKTGRPLRTTWVFLAHQVCFAMQHDFGMEPSSAPNGKLERLFRACLEAGLTTLGRAEEIPYDLRQYTRLALHKPT